MHDYSPHKQILQWETVSRSAAVCIPSKIRPWLVDRDSLTRQVTRACKDAFSVRVLAQSWQRLNRQDANALGLQVSQRAIVREVHLLCGETPWVYARSVIPRAAMHGHYAVLGEMGNRPLGEKLFADPIMTRGEVAFTALLRGSELYRHALSGVGARPKSVYGRRSLFSGARAPVMVTEFFLPDIGDFPRSSQISVDESA